MTEAALPLERIDSSNQLGVGVAANGEVRIHWQPTEAPLRLTRSQALNLLAWLSVMIDPFDEQRPKLVKLIIEKRP